MKKKLTFLLVLVVGILNAQVTTVATGLASPSALALYETDVYFSEYTGSAVSKIDITATTPSVIEVFGNLSEISSIAFTGSQIYLAKNGSTSDKLYNADLNDMPPVLASIDVESPIEININGDYLYITSFEMNSISRMDLTATTPTLETISAALSGPVSSYVYGTDLYIAEFSAGKVSKIDLTNPGTLVDVVMDLDGPNHVTVFNDHLFITAYSGDRILTLDLLTPNAEPEELIAGLDGPSDLVVVPSVPFYELYITEYNGGNIVKFTTDIVNVDTMVTDTMVSVVETTLLKEALSIYPNPSQDYIMVENLKSPQKVEVISIEGKILKTDFIDPKEQLDVRGIPSGAYVLRLGGERSLLFVKE